MAIAYIGLGANIGDPEEQVLRAVHEIGAMAQVCKISTLRETEPVGITDQPNFINGMLEIETEFSPKKLMEELLLIEEQMGRTRSQKGGPREIDLDLVAYDQEIVEEENLKVPHPEMHKRAFVLEPFSELNPDWVHPILKKTSQELLGELSD